MDILIPILGFGRAGGYRVLSQLANHWKDAGHNVDFLVPSTSAAPYFPTTAGIIWVDIWGRLSTADNPPFENNKESGWRNILSIWRGLWARRNRYDVVLANHSFTAWPVALTPLTAKKFYYIQAYEPEYFELARQKLNKIVSRLSYSLRLSQIANAPIYCRFREINTDLWVPPGLDLQNYRPNAITAGESPKSRYVIGCIGRSEPSKGTSYIIDAFERLHSRNSDWRLKVAFGNLPIGYSHPGIEIIVPSNDAELAEFYRSVGMLVAAGTVQHGAAHYPVLEAMACGTPVITTGYLPANKNNAWLVPNKDSKAIALAANDVATCSNVGTKVEQALTDVQCYAWETVASRMISIFSDRSGSSARSIFRRQRVP